MAVRFISSCIRATCARCRCKSARSSDSEDSDEESKRRTEGASARAMNFFLVHSALAPRMHAVPGFLIITTLSF
jgi:hypothetical protein